MQQIQLPQGMKDTILNECEKKKYLQNTLEQIFESFGYEEIITPTIEYYETYENAFKNIQTTDMYKFFDENGRILTLRTDMTVPIARVCASKFKDSKPPFRYRYTSNVFKVRQKFAGKRSEVTDCGIELIGLDSKSDVQVLCCAVQVLCCALEVMKNFKNYTLEIGNVKFFQAACKVVRLSTEEVNTLANLIDKKSMVDLKFYLDSLYLSEKIVDFFMHLPFLCGDVNILDEAYTYCFDDSLKDVLDSMKECIQSLKELGYLENVTVDLGKVAHLDYYTGIIFEGYVSGVGTSILSGGRYDCLLKKFGRDLPACGFSVKLDPLIDYVDVQSKKKYKLYYPQDKQIEAMKQAKNLRKEGIVILEPSTNESIYVEEVQA